MTNIRTFDVVRVSKQSGLFIVLEVEKDYTDGSISVEVVGEDGKIHILPVSYICRTGRNVHELMKGAGFVNTQKGTHDDEADAMDYSTIYLGTSLQPIDEDGDIPFDDTPIGHGEPTIAVQCPDAQAMIDGMERANHINALLDELLRIADEGGDATDVLAELAKLNGE